MVGYKDNQTGVVEEPLDYRDYIYEPIAGSAPMTDEEWKKGYDIEKELGFNLTPKNQFSSSSCVGQGSSMYKAILDVKNKSLKEQSAKAIYSQIFLPSGGAYVRDAAKLIKKWGSLLEKIVPSYKADGTTDETFMRDKTWLTPQLTDKAERFATKDYRKIMDITMDGFAKAIKEGHGVIAALRGTNNGTWHSLEPQPPKGNENTWGHLIYWGKFGIDAKGKYISILNSWGNKVGNRGWQKIRENYFKDSRWIFNPWVFIENNMDTQKFIKEHDKYLIRNIDTGSYGVIYGGRALLISEQRAGLFMIDRDARNLIGTNLTAQLSDNDFTQIEWKNF